MIFPSKIPFIIDFVKKLKRKSTRKVMLIFSYAEIYFHESFISEVLSKIEEHSLFVFGAKRAENLVFCKFLRYFQVPLHIGDVEIS